MNWAKAQPELKDCKAIFSILVTPRTVLDKIALPHASGLYLMRPSDMASLFERTNTMLVGIRSTMTDEFDEELKERILSELMRTDLSPNSIQALLLSRPAAKA